MPKIRILAYSDIHHDEYKNGLTGQDVYDIECQFTKLIGERKCDMWVFAGDRFASRNPYDITRHRADKALVERADAYPSMKAVGVVGNHDQWKKNARLGHSMLLSDKLYPNMSVFDAPIMHQPFDHLKMYIIPSGFEGTELPKWDVETPFGGMRMAIYHGMLAGSKYQNGLVAEHGWDAQTLNNPAFDLVLCGDNHAHQKLDILGKTQGWYVGAPMQHSWGDAGAERGFMYFEYDTDTRHLEHEFIPSRHPKFIKMDVQAESSKELLKWASGAKQLVSNNILRINVLASNESLAKLDTSAAEAMVLKLGARKCEFKPKFDNSAIVIKPGPAQAITDTDVWNEYIKAAAGALEGVDASLIAEMAKEYFD